MGREEQVNRLTELLRKWLNISPVDWEEGVAGYLIDNGFGDKDRFTALLVGSIEQVKKFASITKNIKIEPIDYTK